MRHAINAQAFSAVIRKIKPEIKRPFLMLCMIFLVTFAGCYKPTRFPEIVAAPQGWPIEVAGQRVIVGTSIENRPIECLVLSEGEDVIFILATIHGNEPAGTPLVYQLAGYLQQHPHLLQGRKVVLLPVANPDGMAYNQRYNARGVDLNRNFSTVNRWNNASFGYTALSEPEARVIARLIRQHKPDRIVTVHQPLACIDYDGPALALARLMAQYCDLPIQKLGAQPGSLGSYAGLILGIPIVTFELPRSADRLGQESLWGKYGRSLIAAVEYPSRAK